MCDLTTASIPPLVVGSHNLKMTKNSRLSLLWFFQALFSFQTFLQERRRRFVGPGELKETYQQIDNVNLADIRFKAAANQAFRLSM